MASRGGGEGGGWAGGSTAGTVRLEPQQQAKPAVGEKNNNKQRFNEECGAGESERISKDDSSGQSVNSQSVERVSTNNGQSLSHTASLRLASALHSLSSNSVGHF